MKLLHEYQNGNYTVKIYDNGTKIKETQDDQFFAGFPESIDLKITNYCDLGCAYCHENSTTEGKHGDINLPFLKTLRKGTECAIGGGNPLSHPQLIELLTQLKEQGVVASITINQKHCRKYINLIKKLIEDELIYGIGISSNGDLYDFYHIWKELEFSENVVLHIINGVVNASNLVNASKWVHVPKILILGYKHFRRGVSYFDKNWEDVLDKQIELKKRLPKILKYFPVISFDNLALDQLNVQNIVSEKEWNDHFMGDDGTHTMYVDLVEQQFALSSRSANRFDLKPTIDEMFDVVKTLYFN